jgi:hypothetical protein
VKATRTALSIHQFARALLTGESNIFAQRVGNYEQHFGSVDPDTNHYYWLKEKAERDRTTPVFIFETRRQSQSKSP